MSRTRTASNVEMLETLSLKQKSTLERLRIHQSNLSKLLVQEAKHGISVPLSIMNDIELQQQKILKLEGELDDISKEMKKIPIEEVKQQFDQKTPEDAFLIDDIKKETSQQFEQEKPKATFLIDGIQYGVECPFPALSMTARVLPGETVESIFYYAGGFEVHSIAKKDFGINISFYRHNRQIVPIFDEEARKIRIPLGVSISVSALVASTQQEEALADIPLERILEGRWTIISPSKPQKSVMISEWPQGYNDYLVTSKITYEKDYEVWITQTFHSHPGKLPILIWFYIGGWNVAPIIDKSRFALMFPN